MNPYKVSIVGCRLVIGVFGIILEMHWKTGSSQTMLAHVRTDPACAPSKLVSFCLAVLVHLHLS